MKTLLAIPNYNDSSRLEPFLEDLLARLPDSYEILVSDDGSAETERVALKRLVADAQAKHGEQKVREPLFAEKNQGKGAAILRAWEQAGEVDSLAFADADGAVSASEILRAMHFLKTPILMLYLRIGSRCWGEQSSDP